MKNVAHVFIEDDKGRAMPRALTTPGTRFLTPLLKPLDLWEEVKLSSELDIRFGLPNDGLGFWFHRQVMIRRLADATIEEIKRFEIKSTYVDGSPLVIFYQNGRHFYFEKEETCRIVW